MRFLAMSLASLLCFASAYAQIVPQNPDSPAVASTAQIMPDRFMYVTAENGQEWIEQCEWPAHKSDSMARIAACVSFLQGARVIASKRDPLENCPVDLASQSRGTLLTSTYQIARRYPRMPINKIFRIAFDSVLPGSC